MQSSGAPACAYLRAMEDEKENTNLIRVVAEICDLLMNVILLAPTEQREELCSFALAEMATISHHVCSNNSTQH